MIWPKGNPFYLSIVAVSLPPDRDLTFTLPSPAPMDPIRDYSRCVLNHPQTSFRKNSADSREGSPDSIIHSPSFTFLVGPKHTRLTIQSGLAQHVSKPLHNLMNNGHTRESKHRIAVLEDEDAETFVAFCEYAYTGDYRVPRSPVPQPEHRAAVVESAPSPGHSWRQSYRSESISSLVPPPAPSPPPETIEATSPTAPAPAPAPAEAPAEPEPTPVIEEDVSAEAAAEEMDQQEGGITEPKEADVFHDPQESTVPSQPVTDGEPPAPANDTDDVASWGLPNTNAKKSKKDAKKKKKKGGYQAPTEELPVNLTPPSTPPPALPEVDEISPEEALDEPVVEHASLEPESVEQGEPEPEPKPEAEADADAPAESMPEPELGPEQEPKPETGLEDWGETSNPTPEVPPENQPEEEAPAEEAWDEGTENQDVFNNEAVESPPKPFIDMSFVKQSDSSPHTPGLSLWDEFGALQYNDDGPATAAAPVEVCTDDLPYLTFHAKVYVFATRYLIPTLAQLCLRKLHRDLLHLTFADAEVKDPSLDPLLLGGLAARQAPMVLDLLRYAYTKTTRLEPISPTSATQLRENELRRLVVHYAACKVKELSRYHSFGDSGRATPAARLMDSQVDRAEDSAPKSLRVLLDLTPELASDLVYRMM